ncbi:MAG TPA: hypothetical protein VF531_15645 [Bacillota bacterium]
MNRLIRGAITGSLIGAGIGVTMLWMRRRNQSFMKSAMVQPHEMRGRTRGTLHMVKNNAMRWTSAVKSGTEAFSRRLAHRIS